MAIRPLLFALLLAGSAFSADSLERVRLYTMPDPANPGGLKGRIVNPSLPIEQILAMPDVNPEELYAGEITGTKRDTFQFTGLPAGKYDLVVICDSSFYEGFQLNRDASTLTPDDLKKIEATIQKSEPFFSKKVVHRIEGLTGRASAARAICTYLRDKISSERADFRRTYKVVILKDVGPGWQIVRARDLYPVWTDPGHSFPSHHYSASLNQLRVADQIKDLGDIDLTR
ncbi:MAG: hypothetical protein WCS31_10990 [Verrucomicrobiae bacterium]